MKHPKLSLLLALLASAASSQTAVSPEEFGQSVFSIVSISVCGLFYMFWLIAGGVAIVVIVITGVKWISSSDDPGARKNAKETIIHVLTALIVIAVSSALVDLASGGRLSGCM